MDSENVRAILEWPSPRSITEVRRFHALTTFYRKFIQNFSSFVAPITDCTKGKTFMWINEVEESFMFLKKKVTEAPILALPFFFIIISYLLVYELNQKSELKNSVALVSS
jgi:hypothetical protein